MTLVHTQPLPACALVALTRSSPALRAKTAYEGGGYEFHSCSETGKCLLHASMTLHFPVSECVVNCNGEEHRLRKHPKKWFDESYEFWYNLQDA